MTRAGPVSPEADGLGQRVGVRETRISAQELGTPGQTPAHTKAGIRDV